MLPKIVPALPFENAMTGHTYRVSIKIPDTTTIKTKRNISKILGPWMFQN